MEYSIIIVLLFGLVSCHPRGLTSSAISNNIPVAVPYVTSKLDPGAKATFYFTPEVTQARDNFQAAYNYLSQLSHLAPDDPVWPVDTRAIGIPVLPANPSSSPGAEPSLMPEAIGIPHHPENKSITPGTESSPTPEDIGILFHPENPSSSPVAESSPTPKVNPNIPSKIIANGIHSNNEITDVTQKISSTAHIEQPMTISEIQESASKVSSLIALRCNIIDPTQDMPLHISNKSIVIKTSPHLIGMNFDNAEAKVAPSVLAIESTSPAPKSTMPSSSQGIIITVPTSTPRLLKKELAIVEDDMIQTTSQQPRPLESTTSSTELPVTPSSHSSTTLPQFSSATKIIRMNIPIMTETPKIRMKINPESRTSKKLDRIAEESVNTLSPITTTTEQATFAPTTYLPSTLAINSNIEDTSTSTTNPPTLANPTILTTTNVPTTTPFPAGYQYGALTPEVAQATANFFRQYLIDTVRNGEVSQGRLVLRKR